MSKKLTQQNFILRAKQIHENYYDYSQSVYINCHTKIIIICPTHGPFSQEPTAHLSGQGCKICAYDLLSKSNQKEKIQVIQDFIKVHGNKFDYSKVVYINNKTKVCIICTEHGEFWQTPNCHLNGQGCPTCRQSKGEKEIERWLKERNINFIPQYRFKDCRNKRPLPFDFYLPELNTCIEYDGELHFQRLRIKDKEKAKRKLEQTKIYDRIKNKFCLTNKIYLIRISYKENIIEKLNNYLNKPTSL